MDDKNSKEMNLIELLNLLGKWIKKVTARLIRFVGFLLQLAFKHWVVSAIVLLLSVVAGQYLARPSVRRYEANAMAMLYGCENSTVKEVFRQLQNSLIPKKSTTFSSMKLATVLGIPDSVAENIVKLESYNVIDYLDDNTPDMVDFDNSHSLKDTMNLIMKNHIFIQVQTLKPTQIRIFQDALLNYFNNNPMLKSEFESTKTGIENKIRLCDTEIQRLDSLANLSYFKDSDKKISLENNNLIVGEQKKQLFYEDVLRLQDIRNLYNKKLVLFKKPIDFPAGLIVNPVPKNGRIKYGVYSIFIGSLLALIMVYLIDNLKKIINYLINKK